jgi:hypothetical protein
MKTFQEFQEDLNALQKDLSSLHKKGELRRRTSQSGEALQSAVQKHREVSAANREKTAATSAEFKKKNAENLEKIKKQKERKLKRNINKGSKV